MIGLHHSEGTQTLVALRRDGDDTWGNMTPEQALALAKALINAAHEAAEETRSAAANALNKKD